nr:unnamed protein product [Callosobruchus chinensis]
MTLIYLCLFHLKSCSPSNLNLQQIQRVTFLSHPPQEAMNHI